MKTIYEKLSDERKQMQADGVMPTWWSTGGWQLFKDRYLYQAANPREQMERIAATLSVHTPDPNKWKGKFMNLMWKGWLSPASPVWLNVGTTRGLPVSCAGNNPQDNMWDIYNSKLETAMLTKNGFGTASYLGDIRPRGANITGGGKASGVMPIIKGLHSDMDYVAQGTARRGSWAAYLPIDHGDFHEVCTYLEQNPDGNNVGWNIGDRFIKRLQDGDEEALDRYQEVMRTKMTTGKGYFWFTDKANDARPQWYKERGLEIKSSQLCSEIALHSSEDYTFTCVLSSMNVDKYDEWVDTDAVFDSIVFLDSVCQEFIERAKNMKGLEKAVAFTKKSRALGLGAAGFSSYLYKNMIPYESLEAQFFDQKLFKGIRAEAERATEWLYEQWGAPEWCQGHRRANTHLLAVAPTKSSAQIMGGISEGINPDAAMVYTARLAGGEINRVNPYLLQLMKDKGIATKANIEAIRDAMGSIQGFDWFTEHEKAVFKTAFEIDQHVIARRASLRGKHLCQWQSVNFFFSYNDTYEYISSVMTQIFLDRGMLGAYYVYSKAGVQASRDDCFVCQ